MKPYTIRLKEGQFFKEEIEGIAKEKPIKAGVLLSVVGGLENVVLRMPKFGEEKHIIKEMVGPFELVSGTGTISPDGCHIHISVSDKDGHCYGGHLKDGCAVKNTIEVVIGIFENVTYKRVFDSETGFNELSVE
jgi:predicted DNA-binding protein with PD1-like motif